MRSRFWTALLSMFVCGSTCASVVQDRVYFLHLPTNEAKRLGVIDKITVEVSCGSISALQNVPELYDIDMGYDIPSTNTLNAEPRLGASAVDISKWNDVVGVRLPSDPDARSCFNVKVTVEGRSGARQVLHRRQLGLP